MNPLARERRSRDTRPQLAWRPLATPCNARSPRHERAGGSRRKKLQGERCTLPRHERTTGSRRKKSVGTEPEPLGEN